MMMNPVRKAVQAEITRKVGVCGFLLVFAAVMVPPAAAQNFTDIGASLPPIFDAALEWGDYDNDGDLDLAMAGFAPGTNGIARIMRNDAGTFVNSGAALQGVGYAALDWGDYDNDGDLDLALCGAVPLAAVTKIYRNDGNGVFTDINAGLAGVYLGDVRWGDYDNDGDLDLGVLGSAIPGPPISKIYRNDGGGTFTDINAALMQLGNGGIAWGDYDNDNDLDLVMGGGDTTLVRQKIYRNDGAGVFTDIGAGLPNHIMPDFDWGDYDNDGDLDLAMVASGSTRIYRNDGNGVFTPLNPALVTLGNQPSAQWGDYDNDGDIDLLVTGGGPGTVVTKLYRNDGGGTFTDTLAPLQQVDRGQAAWGDYDADGDLDIALTGTFGLPMKIYRNDGASANTVPGAPTHLGVTMTGSRVEFRWQAPLDSQTPQAGLSYNIELGTTSGAIDIATGMANAAGLRDVVRLGNAQPGTTWRIEGLQPYAMYCWRVQAIDGAYAGGAWSTEFCFDLANGDINGDGGFDIQDFWVLPVCLTGPGVDYPDTACRQADTDLDFDVDLQDLSRLQVAFDM
jgi:hypothetical protein